MYWKPFLVLILRNKIYSILSNQIILIRVKNTLFVFCASCIVFNRLQYAFRWPLPLPSILKENVWEIFVYLLDSDIWHESFWIEEKWSSCMLNVTWSIYTIQRNAIMWVHLIFHCYSEKGFDTAVQLLEVYNIWPWNSF